MNLIKLIDFPLLNDSRGSLVALEVNKQIPFEIKRVYYIYGTKGGVARGFHAHKNLKQVAICLSGSCKFILDDGLNKEDIILSSPEQGLLIDSVLWREMHDFSDDCVLMVLASEHYDENDYIRDYRVFLEETNDV
ncbi:WxcM-like domain-containing protein [Shewanella algae]|uniref:WxcM-like domain-containing protein n=1 Tax=Shewanella algae TaxID=38313 RepID=UPI001AAE4B50|nr:WxcM-like domain-containing protein [Shewanella algae]